jgi:diguanylate cyclase (GGDEF)-like protein/PAS domain S-box-containing protein
MNLTLSAICDTGDYLVPLEATLQEAIAVMRTNGKGAVVVAEGTTIRGILTERDVVSLVSSGARSTERILSHITPGVIRVQGNRSLLHALIIMTEHDIRRLVVTDEQGGFLGLITQKDLLQHIEDDAYRSNLKIRHIQERVKRVIHIAPGESTRQALKLMSEHHISAIPVFEEAKPVGIISERDVLDLMANASDLDRPVREYMISPIISVDVDFLVLDVVKLMNTRNIRRVLITDKNDLCLGIVTQKDILKNFENDYKTLMARKLKHTKDVLNLLPEMILEVLDDQEEQVIVWANSRCLDFFGQEITDKAIDQLLPKSDWLPIYVQIMDQGRIERVKVTTGVYTLEVSGFYLRSESGSERGRIKLIIRDITESEEQKRSIRSELDTYLRVINSTADMILLYGAYDGKIKIANESALKILGLARQEIGRWSIYDIVTEEKSFLDEKIANIVKEDKVIKGVRHYRKADGKTFPVEVTATKVILENSIYILVVARDISEKLAMEQIIQRRNEELTLFHNFINSLNRSGSIEEAYEVLTFYIKHIGLDGVHIYKINPSLTRISESSVSQEETLWKSDCLSSDVNHCKVVLSGTHFTKNSCKEFGCPLAKLDKQVKSYMCLSVYSSGKLIAIVSLLSHKEGFFDQEITRFLGDLFNAFSLLISNLRLIEINRELSIRDPLTNLYNRRFLGEYLEKEIENSRRSGAAISAVMIDLDDFKQLNDHYGHEVGDLALKVVAGVIDRAIRKGDIAARFGGEEFLLVLPASAKEGAMQMAERVRTTLERTPITTAKGGRLYITASFGIASFVEDEARTAEKLIQIADTRLYEAKNGGKNAIVAD